MAEEHPIESLQAAADAYLADCFAARTAPRVTELAARLGMSVSAFSRAFVNAAGRAPSAYLKAECIVRAQQLLDEGALPLEEVAACAGFGTRVSFFRAFRRATGLTPQQYRRRGA